MSLFKKSKARPLSELLQEEIELLEKIENTDYSEDSIYEEENPAGRDPIKHINIINIIKDKCSGCLICEENCFNGAIKKDENSNLPVIDMMKCTGCKTCISVCENNAIEMINSNYIELDSELTPKELSYITGLDEEKCIKFMKENNLSGDEALEAIDIFIQSLNEDVQIPIEIAICMKNADIYTDMANRLNAYNTMRGGVKGYGGFVFEEMHAAEVATKGVNIDVLGNNGIADFIVKDAKGHETLVQAKAGYKPNQIDWNKYCNQTIVVDKGNTALAEEARRAGLTVQESPIFKKHADVVARAQQWESKVIGKTNAPITGTVVSSHSAGMASAKLAARVGVSMKLGENIYDVISGNKDFSEATADVIVDGALLIGGAYLGSAALTAAGTVATSVGSAIAGTSAGIAITGTVGTAVGGTIATGVGTTIAAAGTVVGTIASAPLAPVVATGAALGFVFKAIKDNF